MSFEIHKEQQVHGSAAAQLRLQIEHLKRTVKSPHDLIEHVIQLYGAEFEKANAALAEQKRANDELFLIKQRVVIANRELLQANNDLVRLLQRVLAELPAKRDWLDPQLEQMMRGAAKPAAHMDAAAIEAHKRKAEDTPA